MIHIARAGAACTVLIPMLLPLRAEPAAPAFVVETAAGDRPAATVERLGRDGAITLAGTDPVPAGDMIALRRAGTAIPVWPTGPQLLFTNGDRLAGEVRGCDGRTLQFQPSGFAAGPLTIPLSRVSVLWRAAPPHELSDSDRWYPLLNGQRRRDALLMRNGDTIVGDLLGFDAAETRLQTSGEQRVATDKVAAVAFNTELARARGQKGLLNRLVLNDGSRLTLASVTADAKTLSGYTDYKQTVTIPWERVVALTVVQGRAVYLSELKPQRYSFEPFLSENYPWVPDRNVFGGPLLLRTGEGLNCYDKGIGLHSRSTLVYALDRRYRRFEALVGLDDRAGVQGAVAVRCFLDGKASELPGLSRLRHDSEAVPVRLDVRGTAELKIEIDWGEGGHVGDAVNLAEARLIRAH